MSEVLETKDGIVILECDCGIVHKLKWNEEKETIEAKSSIKKKETDEKTKDTKRSSIFGNKK